MGSYDHQAKIRECFIEAPETLRNILRLQFFSYITWAK
jgi:hypothetical protein